MQFLFRALAKSSVARTCSRGLQTQVQDVSDMLFLCQCLWLSLCIKAQSATISSFLKLKKSFSTFRLLSQISREQREQFLRAISNVSNIEGFKTASERCTLAHLILLLLVERDAA